MWRRMKRLKCVERVRINENMNKIKESRTLLDTITKRKGDGIEHILRGKILLTTALEGTVEEERRRRRKRLKLIDN